jgi:hypothetical protein
LLKGAFFVGALAMPGKMRLNRQTPRLNEKCSSTGLGSKTTLNIESNLILAFLAHLAVQFSSFAQIYGVGCGKKRTIKLIENGCLIGIKRFAFNKQLILKALRQDCSQASLRQMRHFPSRKIPKFNMTIASIHKFVGCALAHHFWPARNIKRQY